MRKLYLILYNIRSVHNAGSIFRTADGAGVTKIFLVGVTPAPTDRFGRARSDFSKVALGAEMSVAWEAVSSAETLIDKLKKDGVQIIALEQSQGAQDYRKINLAADFTLIVGSEIGGLPEEILNQCDQIAEIPMHGKKESLNVSVATGIALFQLLKI